MRPQTHQYWISSSLALLASMMICAADKNNRGADETTPSRAEYFSWINNAWDGSTEAQTLANLAFFQWLRDEYGMQLDIYAFDAGNIDTQGGYGSTDSARFREKFPAGFSEIARRARQVGCRLGMWGGPDGFGKTPEEEARRTEMIVSLCRDYQFGLLKLDGACSGLRPEKRQAFIHMMEECRKHDSNLIVLNHRIDLGEAEPWVTTFLFEGAETYIDVWMANDMGMAKTATHNRAGALSRNLVPGLRRLTEDHGVCLSSCLDYWEDDLILQAFNRCLILAPEIYGNPWLLRDDEFAKLARIFNLHRRYRNILVNGMTLPEQDYGPCAVSRGDDQTRFLTLRNLTWNPVKYAIRLNSSIGLANNPSNSASQVELRRFHPSERILGRYAYGSTVQVEVLPFRSCFISASAKPLAEVAVEGCDYEIIRDLPGKPVVARLLASPGDKTNIRLVSSEKFTRATIDGKRASGFEKGAPASVSFTGKLLKENWHRKLGDLKAIPVPEDAEALYEATCYAADNNALEVRSLERSGPTHIAQVQKARDALFQDPLFRNYGIWDRYLFDGRMDTEFKPHLGKPRHGGALRVDFGQAVQMDRLVLKGGGIKLASGKVEISADLKTWTSLDLRSEQDSLVADVAVDRQVRYIRTVGLPKPISEVEGYRNGKPLDRKKWRASNLFAPYAKAPATAAWSLSFKLDQAAKGSYLAIALPGRHGIEGAVAAIRVDGRAVGAPSRAVSYPANVWEYFVREVDGNYTYYIPVTGDMANKQIDAIALVLADGVNEIKPEAWITAYPIPQESHELVLLR